MAKKILCVIVFMLTLVCTFASCSFYKDETPSHTHNFGEWEIIKSATCTAEGSKERYCSCGEKQTSTIAANHNFVNGICSVCGYENRENGNNNNSSVQKLSKDEWMAVFDSSQYQSYTMRITSNEKRGDRVISQTITIQYNYPEFMIVSTETDAYDGVPEIITDDIYYILGGAEELSHTAAIPYAISDVYSIMSEFDGFGYSKFVFDETSASYSSLLFENIELVTVSIQNGKIRSITIENEYNDSDYGKAIETYSIELSNINKTSTPSAPILEATAALSEAVSSINSITEARRGYQSSHVYNTDEAKETFNLFFDSFSLDNKTLLEYNKSQYTEIDLETKEEYKDLYTDIDVLSPEVSEITIFGDVYAYDIVSIVINNGNIQSITLYNDSIIQFSIYFFY